MRLVVVNKGEGITMRERTILLVFLIRCFNSLEVEVIRDQVQKVISLPMWSCLLPGRLQQVRSELTMRVGVGLFQQEDA